MKKKLLSLLLIATLIIGLAGCGSKEKEESQPQEKTYRIGDTVSTDIIEFTLDASEPSTKLSSINNQDFGLPVEYKDGDTGMFVAPKGKSYVYTEFTVSNKDRVRHNFKKENINTIYNGETVPVSFSATKRDYFWDYADEWNNEDLYPEETISIRGYNKITGEVDELKGQYKISISLPNSSGKNETFTYVVDINN